MVKYFRPLGRSRIETLIISFISKPGIILFINLQHMLFANFNYVCSNKTFADKSKCQSSFELTTTRMWVHKHYNPPVPYYIMIQNEDKE